jgi:hypothetical protein
MQRFLQPDQGDSQTRILAELRRYWGYTAFRGPQGEIISHAIQGKDSLVVMATGAGKSLCMQVRRQRCSMQERRMAHECPWGCHAMHASTCMRARTSPACLRPPPFQIPPLVMGKPAIVISPLVGAPPPSSAYSPFSCLRGRHPLLPPHPLLAPSCPQISLMEDQVQALTAREIPACFLGSSQTSQQVKADAWAGR